MFGSIFGMIGGAVGDFAMAQGYQEEAQGMFQAASIYGTLSTQELQNAQIVQQSGVVQSYQLGLQIQQQNAQANAAIAGGNLSGGSAGYILQMGNQQGALAQSVLKSQTALNVAGYQQASESATAQEDITVGEGNAALAASEAASAAGWTGLLGGAVGLIGMFAGI